MDTVLQGTPHVIYYIDDILVTGSNNGDHLRNLATVFERLTHYGFCLKQDKCEFLKDSVEFLGHKIDAEGLHAMPSKVEAIEAHQNPKTSRNSAHSSDTNAYYFSYFPHTMSLWNSLDNECVTSSTYSSFMRS